MRIRALTAALLLLAATAASALARPGWLGVAFTQHGKTPPRVEWLSVRAIEPDGPADRAGLEIQDVIVAIGGKPVAFRDSVALLDYFATVKPGQRVTLSVRRGKETKTIVVTAAAMTDAQFARWKRNYDIAKQRD